MNVINIVLIISIVALISTILKKYTLEYSMMINIILSLILIVYIISNFSQVFVQIKHLIDLAKIPEKYWSVLMKCLGICFITQFASDSCKDAKETSLASKIEIIGKFAMMTTSIPLFEEITKTAFELIGVT